MRIADEQHDARAGSQLTLEGHAAEQGLHIAEPSLGLDDELDPGHPMTCPRVPGTLIAGRDRDLVAPRPTVAETIAQSLEQPQVWYVANDAWARVAG